MEIDIRKRSIGLNFKENGEAEIRLWAPLAERVSFFVMDGAAPVDMVGEGFGYWLLKTDMIKAFDLYGFKIFPLSGGEMLERADPAFIPGGGATWPVYRT